jgi:rhodanese-related sulfurtransferase
MRAVARTTIDELLADVQRRLTRLDPAQALQAMHAGAALIDIRSDTQVARDGIIAGALVIPRNVLEWRLDPASHLRHPRAPQLDDQVILLCDEGYQSSLAAATLQHLGFAHATDVEGGFQAWRAAGLPVEQPSPPPREAASPAPASVPERRVTGHADGHFPRLNRMSNERDRPTAPG